MSSRIDNIASWLGGNRLEDRTGGGSYKTSGTATSSSSDGFVDVIIGNTAITDGDDGISIRVPTSVQVIQGDSVTITVDRNNPMVTDVIGGGDRMNFAINAAEKAAEKAEQLANEAKEAAEADDQHFFDDENGIHVATAENDANTGPNLLANSVGILMRDGTILRTAMTPSGFAVYDGRGNEEENIVALFADTTTIGRMIGNRVVLNNDSIDMYNADGIVVHIGEIAGTTGEGMPTVLPYFHFGDEVDYGDSQPGRDSFVAGEACKAAGEYSQAYGTNCSASGTAAHASGMDTNATGFAAFGHGYGINASSGMVVGQFNATPIGGALFTVGSGSSNSDRRNTLSVTDGGLDLYNNNLYVTRGQVLDTITKGSATISSSVISSGSVNWVKTGHVVQAFVWLKVKQAVSTYSALNTIATGMPAAARAGEFGILKIDNSTGTVFPNIDTGGIMKIVTRETALAANGVVTGGFTYISSE